MATKFTFKNTDKILEKLEQIIVKVLTKYNSKMRFAKTIGFTVTNHGYYFGLEMAPHKKWSRSHFLFAFEDVIDAIELELNKQLKAKKFMNLEVNCITGSCDLGIEIRNKCYDLSLSR